MVAADGVIYMVLEYGDIDLARLLAKQESARRTAAGAMPDENFIRLYWQQMLQVHSCGPHTCRRQCPCVGRAVSPALARWPHPARAVQERYICGTAHGRICNTRAKHLWGSPQILGFQLGALPLKLHGLSLAV